MSVQTRRSWNTVAVVAVAASVLAACGDSSYDGSSPFVADTPPPAGDTLPAGTCMDASGAEFSCFGVELIARLSLEGLGVTPGEDVGNDVWGWTDPVTKTEWAIVGLSNGTAFVSLEDPRRPVLAGTLPHTGGAHPTLWRDMKVYESHAFIVSDGAGPHGMQVFDLAQLRDVAEMPRTFAETANYSRLDMAHNIAINEETGFAYVVGGQGPEGCGGGLHMIDIRTPADPKFAGCFTHSEELEMRGYTHDTQCVVYRGPDDKYRNKEICFSSNESALSIADVTDKANPTAISAETYPQAMYSHQAWLDEQHEYLYMNDEMDEMGDAGPYTRTIIWDVKELEEPVVATVFRQLKKATDHNLYVSGDRMYQANYSAGLRIFDISRREQPREIGYLVTDPDEKGMNGAWSNYPFFESGIIVVNSMHAGAFFVRIASEK